jgi:hypothetical protein
MKKLSGPILTLALVFLSTAAYGEGSPLDRFSAEERRKLEKGEPVYRHVKSEGTDGKVHGHGEAYAIMNAPVEQCWKIFTEFDKHQLYFPRKKKSEVVKSEGNKYWVYKQFEFYMVTIEYTTLYTVDEKAHRVDYDMDESYPHDLEETVGYFQFEKLDDKRTLFIYAATKVETGLKVPGFVQDYLTSRDLPAVVLNVKKRMESGGEWTKED